MEHRGEILSLDHRGIEGVVWTQSSPEVRQEAKVGVVVFLSKGTVHAVHRTGRVWKRVVHCS